MNRIKLEAAVSKGEYDSEYSDFIIDNCAGDRVIGNGDMLIEAIEDGYLYDEFCDYMENVLTNV